MIAEEDRAWVKLLIHEAVTEAMQAERELAQAAVQLHEQGPEHRAFQAFIDSEQRKTDQWNKITTSVIGAVIIGSLYWVGSHTLDIAAWVLKIGGK